MNGIFEFAVFRSHHAGQWTMHKVKNLARGPQNRQNVKINKTQKGAAGDPPWGGLAPLPLAFSLPTFV